GGAGKQVDRCRWGKLACGHLEIDAPPRQAYDIPAAITPLQERDGPWHADAPGQRRGTLPTRPPRAAQGEAAAGRVGLAAGYPAPGRPAAQSAAAPRRPETPRGPETARRPEAAGGPEEARRAAAAAPDAAAGGAAPRRSQGRPAPATPADVPARGPGGPAGERGRGDDRGGTPAGGGTLRDPRRRPGPRSADRPPGAARGAGAPPVRAGQAGRPGARTPVVRLRSQPADQPLRHRGEQAAPGRSGPGGVRAGAPAMGGERTRAQGTARRGRARPRGTAHRQPPARSEEHTSELQSRENLVCRLLL